MRVRRIRIVATGLTRIETRLSYRGVNRRCWHAIDPQIHGGTSIAVEVLAVAGGTFDLASIRTRSDRHFEQLGSAVSICGCNRQFLVPITACYLKLEPIVPALSCKALAQQNGTKSDLNIAYDIAVRIELIERSFKRIDYQLAGRAQPKRILIVDGIPAREPVHIRPTRDPDRVLLRELTRPRIVVPVPPEVRPRGSPRPSPPREADRGCPFSHASRIRKEPLGTETGAVGLPTRDVGVLPATTPAAIGAE